MGEEKFFHGLVTRNNIEKTFELYVAQKTDTLTDKPQVKVPEGLDSIDYNLFQQTIAHQVGYTLQTYKT